MIEKKHIMPRAPDLEEYIHDGNRRRFITYQQGSAMFRMRYWTFVNFVKKAGANIKMRKTAVVDLYVLEKYERAYREVIEENINTEALCQNYPDDVGIINGIVDLIVDKLTSAKDEIIVCGEPRSANSVKGRLLKLNRFHIEYVLDCWNRLAEPPRKPDQYLLAMLYNAPTTSDAQLKAELNKDYPQYNTALNGRAQ